MDKPDEQFNKKVERERQALTGASPVTGATIGIDAATKGVQAARSALSAPVPSGSMVPYKPPIPGAQAAKSLGRMAAPLAAFGESVNAAAYTAGTDTQDFYKRFGIDPNATPENSRLAAIGTMFPEGSRPNAAFQNAGQFVRDVGARTLGAGSDLAAAAVDVGKGALDLSGAIYNRLPFASDFTGEYKPSDWTMRDEFADNALTYRDYRGQNSPMAQAASAAYREAVTPDGQQQTPSEPLVPRSPEYGVGSPAPAPATASATAPASGTGTAEVGGVRYTYGPDGFTRSDGRPMGGGFMVMPAGAMSQLSPAERASLGELPRAAAQGSSGGRVYGFGQSGRSFQDVATQRANADFEYSMLQTSLQDAMRSGNARLAQQIASRLGQIDQTDVTARGQDVQGETARRQAELGLRQSELSLQNPLQLAQAQSAQYDMQRKQMIDQLVNTATAQPDTPEGQQAAAALQAFAAAEGKGGKAEAPKWITAMQEDANGNKFAVIVNPATGEMIDSRRGIGAPVPNEPGWLLGPDGRVFRDPNYVPPAPAPAPSMLNPFNWFAGAPNPQGTQ